MNRHRRPDRAHPRPLSSFRGLTILALVVAGGCGADDGAPPEPAGPATFIVQATVETPAGRTSVVRAVPTLDLGTLALDRGVELSGAGRVFFRDPEGIFLGSADTPRVTRYGLDETASRLEPVPEDTLSFQAGGFGFLPFGNTFLTRDRAFLLEGSTLSGLVWDPAALEVVTSGLDLSALEREGFSLTIDPGVVRGDSLLVPLQYTNFSSLETPPLVAVAALDIQTAEVSAVLTDERCVGGNTQLARMEDGTVLVAADGFLGLTNLLDPEAPPTCLLRIPPGSETPAFDPDYLVAFPDLLGGRQGLGLVYGGEGVAFVSAFYPERLENDPTTALFDALGERVSRWWRVDLNTRTAAELDIPFHSLRSTVGFPDGDRVYLAVPDRGFEGRSRLFSASVRGDRSPTELFETTGLVTAVHRLAAPDPGR